MSWRAFLRQQAASRGDDALRVRARNAGGEHDVHPIDDSFLSEKLLGREDVGDEEHVWRHLRRDRRHGAFVHLADEEWEIARQALDKATMDKAMGDPKGLLTKVLTNHVVPEKLTPEMLAGDHKTLGGGTITVAGSGEDFTVGKAKVICGNVQTANATVYIIDGVLLPS